jgi:predicted aminopeptidase
MTLGNISGLALLLALVLQLEGCYYLQAARGQLELLQHRRPIVEVIDDVETSPQLRERLHLVGDARQFAVDVLLLPDNDSYGSYVDLGRDYVVWNVVAAPEFSLQPKQWCYPVAGCVAYRGYFSEASAKRLAAKLEAKGFDVMVGGVPAYSTLGRFADPVLNTMMRWSDDELVATLFHELAHQKVYVKDDSQFNESFSTVVAETGIERWRKNRGEFAEPGRRAGKLAEYNALRATAIAARGKLEALYASGLGETAMRHRKQEILSELASDLARLADDPELPDRMFGGRLNNARLGLLTVYSGRVSAFNMLLKTCQYGLSCFYEKVETLADMSKASRDERLDLLAAGEYPDI